MVTVVLQKYWLMVLIRTPLMYLVSTLTAHTPATLLRAVQADPKLAELQAVPLSSELCE